MNKADIRILRKLVRAEATKLRELLTDVEKSNLYFHSLNSKITDSCIYGQITGHCDSTRAVLLMNIACERVYSRKYSLSITGNLNGSPFKLPRYRFWSPIEIFIDLHENIMYDGYNNAQLIKYIKGKINVLKFKAIIAK